MTPWTVPHDAAFHRPLTPFLTTMPWRGILDALQANRPRTDFMLCLKRRVGEKTLIYDKETMQLICTVHVMESHRSETMLGFDSDQSKVTILRQELINRPRGHDHE